LLGSGNEPDDHAIGRFRGGLTTKTHALVDGRGQPLVLPLTTGDARDSPALAVLLDQIRIPRCCSGRRRTTPDALRGDKACSAKAHRENLRARDVKVVIPEKTDQRANRESRGSRGGGPVDFDAEDHNNRNVVD
jgi:putative transposase